MEYSFFVPGHPEPQSRPRFSSRRIGLKTITRAYEAEKVTSFKQTVYALARKAFNEKKVFLQGALELQLIVFREIPKAFSQKKAKLAAEGQIYPTQRPDLDNYIKSALDGIGLKNMPKIIFSDDAQIVRITAEKRYSFNGQVGMAIEIKELMPTVARESFVKEERVNG